MYREQLSAVRKAQIESQFSRAADMYAVSEHRAGSDLDTLIEFAEPVGDDVVLDVATGAGHVALALAPLVSSVVATDLATGMVDKARERGAEAGVGNLECRVADAERLPFDDEAFDLVTCRIAPHHFVDIDAAVREAARVLCPGGRYVVVDSMSPDDPDLAAFLDMVERRRDPTHVRSYRRDEWMHIIDRAGLHLERVASLRKGRSFEFWLERGGVDGEDADELREMFRGASDAAREYFEIQIDGDVIKSFTDDKIVIRATWPQL